MRCIFVIAVSSNRQQLQGSSFEPGCCFRGSYLSEPRFMLLAAICLSLIIVSGNARPPWPPGSQGGGTEGEIDAEMAL